MLNATSSSPLSIGDQNYRWSPHLRLAQIAALPRTDLGRETDRLAVQAHSAWLRLSLLLARTDSTLEHPILQPVQ